MQERNGLLTISLPLSAAKWLPKDVVEPCPLPKVRRLRSPKPLLRLEMRGCAPFATRASIGGIPSAVPECQATPARAFAYEALLEAI